MMTDKEAQKNGKTVVSEYGNTILNTAMIQSFKKCKMTLGQSSGFLVLSRCLYQIYSLPNMNINNRKKVGEKGSIGSLSHSQLSFTTANTFCSQKLSCMGSIKFQLLASVFTGSCHLPLPFNDPDTAEPCLLQSAVPAAERMQQCCWQKNRCCSSIIVQRLLLSIIGFFFSFLLTIT